MIFCFTAYTAIAFDSFWHPKVVMFGLSMPRPLINVESEPLFSLSRFFLDASLDTEDTNRCSYQLVSYSSAIKREKCVYHTIVGFMESPTAKLMRHVRQVLVVSVLFTCLLCRLSYHIQPFFLINSAIGMMLAWSV
jgi:hypothetical protein